MTTFSIVIPTYNRANLLERSIRSVLAQSITDFELIVVDDGSVDATAEVVRSIDDPRVRYVHQQNAGAAAARNFGASLAKGRYLTFLDSDDEAMPRWLETLYSALEEQQAEVVCCGLLKIAWRDDVERKTTLLLPETQGPMFDHVVARFTNGGVYAMKREVFTEVGGFTAGLQSGQHTELSMRLIPLAAENKWKIYNVMEPLVRVHEHEGFRIRTNPMAIYLGIALILNMHGKLFARDLRLQGTYHAIAGVCAARIGKLRESRYHFFRAIRLDPLRPHHWGRLLLSLLPGVAGRLWRRKQAIPEA